MRDLKLLCVLFAFFLFYWLAPSWVETKTAEFLVLLTFPIILNLYVVLGIIKLQSIQERTLHEKFSEITDSLESLYDKLEYLESQLDEITPQPFEQFDYDDEDPDLNSRSKMTLG